MCMLSLVYGYIYIFIWIIPSAKLGMAGKRQKVMDASLSCEAFGWATLGLVGFGLLLAMAPWAGNCQGFEFWV